MTKTSSRPQLRHSKLSLALFLAFSSVPVLAGIEIDQSPLTVPEPLPPNIMYIIDDSGSMAWQHMPGTTASWANSPNSGLPLNGTIQNDIRLRAANINTQWYNPTLTYTPWVNHDGTPMSDMNPRAARFDPSGRINGTGTLDLGQTSWPGVTLNSTNTSTTGETWRFRGFYVLNPGASPNSNANYVRYEFRRINGTSNWEARRTTLNTNGSNNTTTAVTSFNWPGGITRTVAQEVQNYANWFSYYRLRASMAKAAASRAFSELGEDFRIGYDTLWQRSSFPIPVGTDNGLFKGTNRETWFSRMFNANASNGTPLRQALGRAGEYYKSTSASGPYGPESGDDQLSCRQNFAIMTTDGYWNSNAASLAAARDNNDGTTGPTITGLGGITYTYEPVLPYSDNRSNTLADVAMYYWRTDLRPDLKNDVPTSAANPAFWQNMRTFGISIGLKGELNPSTDLPALTAGTKSWPAPANDKPANIDDLWHAALNGRGDFIVAASPDEFANALTDALSKIKGETARASNATSNSSKLDGDSKAFFPEYNSGTWSGEVYGYPILPDGEYDSDNRWVASAQLPDWETRDIYFNKGGVLTLFKHDNLTLSQQASFALTLDEVDVDTEIVVDYLRGDRSHEIDQFTIDIPVDHPDRILRARGTVFGDFVNSQLVMVGKPDPLFFRVFSFDGSDEYPEFAANKAGRSPTLYIGSNAGMLHGFDADTGAERFAFIPQGAIDAGLGQLADPDYVHRYFVDGQLTAADVFINDTWRTILVGTMGRGGRSVFALDVTDPLDVKFLWERTGDDIPDLGNSFTKPIVAQVANGDWRVMIGNGPNGNGDEASLIMIKIDDGSTTVVKTGAGGDNGLSGIRAWDSNNDGFADSAYAGDMNGNVWRFSNLAESDPDASLLFVARDGGGSRQPITAAPLTLINPDNGDVWVFVGTGRHLNQEDNKSKNVQSWYGLIDKGELIGDRSTSLVQRTITQQGDIEGRSVRLISTGNSDEMTNKSGWYLDLNAGTAEGEKMLSSNFFFGRVLFGTSFIPDTSDLCNPSGRGYLWGLNPFTGGRFDKPLFDVNDDGVFNDTLSSIPPSAVGIDPGSAISESAPVVVGNQILLEEPVRISGGGETAIREAWREIMGN